MTQKQHWVYDLADKYRVDLADDKDNVMYALGNHIEIALANKDGKALDELQKFKDYLNNHYFLETVNRSNAITARNFEHVSKTNKDGTPLRARRNGMTQVWKTRPEEFKIPIKHGLYDYGYIDHNNCNEWLVSS